jgi:uncharacterized protein YndB with AHSA1/START domain
MSGEGATWIAVTPEAAYAAVTDLPRMGEWSPENRGGEWVGSTNEAIVGATFRGLNRGPHGEWDTTLTVIEADPPARFAFCVAPPGEAGTTWRYGFRSARHGTTVTEAFEWYWTPIPNEGFRGRVGHLPIGEAEKVVSERERHLQDQVERTLANLKQVLEGAASAEHS